VSADEKSSGAVLVVGGGIAGMQAALDLADSGYYVYLIERDEAIGGVMAQLDKTFPTNDCSTCMISPKLVEVGRHSNIELLTLTEVLDLKGQPGDFTVKVLQKPRYVDMDKCIACGACAEKCPKKVDSEYNEGTNQRKAIYLRFPQAVPLKYAIDPETCIYLQKGRCGACEKVCPAGAIKFDDQPRELELQVGAVIVAPGFKIFDADLKPELGHGRYPNVLTSLEFERYLSASGPSGGHVIRPSNHEAPRRVAWIQCVGSRDPSIGQDYCSYVCCMYATKQAILAKEHVKGLEPTIFFMDIRAQGKGFDRYYERAKGEHGVRYVRSMISRVAHDPISNEVQVRYFDEAGELQEEAFDLIVLSCGLKPNAAADELAGIMGLERDAFGFARPQSLNPLLTSRPGVYTCGVFSGPKDIPETVTQASGAAGQAAELLASARGSQVKETIFPPEIDVGDDEPRVGVFICHCGINIAGVVDVPAVVEYARSLPNVAHAENLLFSCSTDSLEHLSEQIKEKRLNRVIVASCSPRTHEPLFRETLRQAGLNPYLFEMANIRDQCSWVHQGDPDAATTKAKDLVRMSLARAVMLQPLKQIKVKVDQHALVIGGGVAGLTSALSLADQGFETTLVERSEALGGLARQIGRTVEGFEVKPYLDELIQKAQSHPKLKVWTESQVETISGSVGAFKVTVNHAGEQEKLGCGAVILAVGGSEYRPEEYLCGQDERIMTQLDFDQILAQGRDLPEEVVMIQCVGSREEAHSYCSRVCCTKACQNALALKELNPKARVTILYRDIRTYSTKETVYRAAREAGVRFVRFEPEQKPEVRQEGGGLVVEVFDQGLRETLRFAPQALVLSAAVRPNPEARKLASRLKLPLDSDGFFMEAHLKLRPVDFAAQGYFLAGLAHGPKFIEESIAQAKGAAGRAAAVLAAEERLVSSEVSTIDETKCVRCLTCLRSCPYGVPATVGLGKALYIDPAACQGCGVCASVCPRKAITLQHHTDAQIMAKEAAL